MDSYYLPDSVWGAGDTLVNERDKLDMIADVQLLTLQLIFKRHSGCLKDFNPRQIIDLNVLFQNLSESFCVFTTSLFLLHPGFNLSANSLDSELRTNPDTEPPSLV